MAAIYHVVRANENFNDAANDLIELTRKAQQEFGGKPRTLYLDIEGHRLKNGAFDHDMRELQSSFIVKNIANYYTKVVLPLIAMENSYEQLENPIPEKFRILDNDKLQNDLKPYEGTLLFTTEEQNQD